MAHRLGDPVLLSSALDANCAAVAEDNCFKQASQFTAQRLALLGRSPGHQPRLAARWLTSSTWPPSRLWPPVS